MGIMLDWSLLVLFGAGLVNPTNGLDSRLKVDTRLASFGPDHLLRITAVPRTQNSPVAAFLSACN